MSMSHAAKHFEMIILNGFKCTETVQTTVRMEKRSTADISFS